MGIVHDAPKILVFELIIIHSLNENAGYGASLFEMDVYRNILAFGLLYEFLDHVLRHSELNFRFRDIPLPDKNRRVFSVSWDGTTQKNWSWSLFERNADVCEVKDDRLQRYSSKRIKSGYKGTYCAGDMPIFFPHGYKYGCWKNKKEESI
jgi:hypothetical protein